MLVAAALTKELIWSTMGCTLAAVALSAVSVAVGDRSLISAKPDDVERRTELRRDGGDSGSERVENPDGGRVRLALSGNSRGGSAERKERKSGDLAE